MIESKEEEEGFDSIQEVSSGFGNKGKSKFAWLALIDIEAISDADAKGIELDCTLDGFDREEDDDDK